MLKNLAATITMPIEDPRESQWHAAPVLTAWKEISGDILLKTVWVGTLMKLKFPCKFSARNWVTTEKKDSGFPRIRMFRSDVLAVWPECKFRMHSTSLCC